MKVCRVCNQEKELTEFYKDKYTPDGLTRSCKECNKSNSKTYKDAHKEQEAARMQKYQQEHRDELLDYARKYREENAEAYRAMRKASRIKNKATNDAFELDRKLNHPEKNQARWAVKQALKTGKLIKGPCAICGTTENIEAHHWSYAKENWLNVIWWCQPHHMRFHGEERRLKKITSAS